MKTETPPATLAAQIAEAVRSVVGSGSGALHEPQFAGGERAALAACLDSTYVSSAGAFVDRFESKLAAYTGARHAVAVVNGTAALHVALRLAGVQPGDEVLVPAITFVATANAVVYCGATPHFVDSEERTLGVDSRMLREYLRDITDIRNGHCVNRATGRIIRAMVPVHALGHPADLDALLALSEEFHLVLLEDAAEALGSTMNGRHVGTFGAMGTLSFNGNKIITTGGGGALLTNDRELARLAKHLTTTAKLPHAWIYEHDEIGYNYRMPNLNAALGCAQLERMPEFLVAKRRLFERYRSAFAGVPCVRVMEEPAGCRSNYWLQALVLDESAAEHRDAVLAATHGAGFQTRPLWTLMHRLPCYRACPRMALPVAESLARRVVNLPSSAVLGAT